MFTLAIDTSDRQFSVALLESGHIIAQADSRQSAIQCQPISEARSPVTGKFPPGVSVKLFPMLKQVFAKAGRKLADLELIAIATGPGLFTGLRVGVVTAKTLAYVHGTPLIGVNTLEVIANQTYKLSPPSVLAGARVIKSVLNAQRQQLFAGSYRIGDVVPEHLQEISANQILDRATWLERLADGDLLTGTGLNPIVDTIQTMTAISYMKIPIADEHLWECSAVGVGELGWRRFMAGQRDDFWTLEPFYFRPSYAE